MKTLFAVLTLMVTLNVSFAAGDLGEGSADCSSMVQSNRASEVVVATDSVEVEASESSSR